MAEFVRVAEQHGLPRVATVQNPYCLINRVLDNGLDETMHRLGVALLAYSPLGFGLLTGKYDGARSPTRAGRMALLRVDEEAALGPPRVARRRRAATTRWRASTA